MAPNMNAYAERFVRTFREECLDHFIFVSEDMLWRVATQFIEHYNTERPHQTLDRTIGDWQHVENSGKIVVDERLGGLLKSARRQAAQSEGDE